MTGSARVVVEVLVLRVDGDGRLAYRVAHLQLGDRTPDAVALDAAGVTCAAPVGTVSHSTSWRYDDGRVVLTYAVAPEPQPHLPAERLARVGIVCSPDPLHPSPDGLHDHHVAAHAVRHLTQLAATDPTVARAAAARPDLWRALAGYAALTAVGDHDQSHLHPGPRHRTAPGGGPLTVPPLPLDAVTTGS